MVFSPFLMDFFVDLERKFKLVSDALLLEVNPVVTGAVISSIELLDKVVVEE